MDKFDMFDNKVIAYDLELARKLNKLLKTYGGGKYTFQDGEEPLFRVPSNLIGLVRERFLGLNAD